MKKLIMAAAAITAGFAMADVVSSSVVGYQEFSLNNGFGMTTMTFKPISGDTIPLQSLIPTGTGVGGYGDVAIQTMDAEGNWDGEYTWFTAENSGSVDGWFDVNFELTDATVNYKQGLFVQTSADDVKITYSGAVATGTIETAVPNGFSMSGNATPVALDLQSITPTGTGVGGYGDVAIQTMDENGNWDGEYTWFNAENSGSEDGWYDADFNLAEKTIAPGQGIFLQASADDVALEYPAAL